MIFWGMVTTDVSVRRNGTEDE